MFRVLVFTAIFCSATHSSLQACPLSFNLPFSPRKDLRLFPKLPSLPPLQVDQQYRIVTSASTPTAHLWMTAAVMQEMTQLKPTVAAEKVPPAELPAEVVDAWKKAGARVRKGYVPKHDVGKWNALPMFEISLSTGGDEERWKEGRMAKLPAPPTPFGLILRGGIGPDYPLDDALLKDLAGLEQLQYLLIWYGNITNDGLKELAPLKNLQCLKCFHTKINDGGMQHIAVLTNLRELYLGQCDLTDAGIAKLAPLTKLESLDNSDSHITGVGLGKLRALKSLNLNGAHIDDRGLAEIASLPELQTIDLNGTNITGAGLGGMKAMRSLLLLSLRTKLSDTGIKELATLKNLKSLAIDTLNDTQLEELVAMSELESLHVSDSHITDEALKRLAEMKGLRMLTLMRCKGVTGKGLAALAAIPRLQEVWLSKIPVGVEGLEALNTLPVLEHLWLNDDLGLNVSDLGKLAGSKSLRTLSIGALYKSGTKKFLTDMEKAEVRSALRKVKVP